MDVRTNRLRNLAVAGLAMLVALCVPTCLEAQHPTGAAMLAPEYEGCNLCHGPHSGQRNGGSIAGAPGLGAASRSCLRCHWTASERMRQPEFSAVPTAVHGKYLQYDLTDDHPLGQVSRQSILEDTSPLVDPTRSLRATVLVGPGVNDNDLGQIECILCHDPHDRHSVIPRTEELGILCGTCHDPASYAFAGHTSLACGNCHSLHGGHDGRLLAERTSTVLCQSCHESGGMSLTESLDVSPTAVVQLPPAPRGHERAPEGECISCHQLHK